MNTVAKLEQLATIQYADVFVSHFNWHKDGWGCQFTLKNPDNTEIKIEGRGKTLAEAVDVVWNRVQDLFNKGMKELTIPLLVQVPSEEPQKPEPLLDDSSLDKEVPF